MNYIILLFDTEVNKHYTKRGDFNSSYRYPTGEGFANCCFTTEFFFDFIKPLVLRTLKDRKNDELFFYTLICRLRTTQVFRGLL